jgi:hypothetical protein
MVMPIYPEGLALWHSGLDDVQSVSDAPSKSRTIDLHCFAHSETGGEIFSSCLGVGDYMFAVYD